MEKPRNIPLRVEKCRICGNGHLVDVLSLGDQVLTGIFPKKEDQPISSGPLELTKCHGADSCGLLQLKYSFDSAEMYGQNYGYRSGLNSSMLSHLRDKVARLRSAYPPTAGNLVLDIGSNDGSLLSFYPAELTRVGMDPTIAKFRSYYQEGIIPIADFFSEAAFKERFGERKAKIVTSIAMLYDLDNPLEFVRQVASILASDGVWHFEQSYLPTMLAETAYDTVCHEHLEYYGLRQIKWMTDRCGLRIVDVELNAINGGSFAVTVTPESSPHASNHAAVEELLAKEESLGLEHLAPYENFRNRVFAHRDSLRRLISELTEKGAKIFGYGASTKGNVILQFCDFSREDLPMIAELNPDKFEAFTPGTLIPIVSEQEARRQSPNYLLVLPWHFRTNLVQREKAYLAAGGAMIFPLPRIEIVTGE